MDTLRTPEAAFDGVRATFPYDPTFVTVQDPDTGAPLRMAAYRAGTGEEVVVLLHGEPTWSYLYRKVMARLVERGMTAVALDLVGFGRSDKPAAPADHSYARHVAWVGQAMDALDLRGITLVGQDWGGLIGLRLVAERPALAARVVWPMPLLTSSNAIRRRKPPDRSSGGGSPPSERSRYLT
jgi:haloalkane dehalogenase